MLLRSRRPSISTTGCNGALLLGDSGTAFLSSSSFGAPEEHEVPVIAEAADAWERWECVNDLKWC